MQGVERDAVGGEHVRGGAVVADEAEQEVLGADVVVVQEPGLVLGQDHDVASPLREPLEHAADRRTSGPGFAGTVPGEDFGFPRTEVQQ